MRDELILSLFDTWNSALATQDPDVVTALYAEEGILLPTVSNQVRHNHSEIRAYFVDFLKKKPQGSINESNALMLGPDFATNSGVYTFEFGDGSTVTARYSYIYKLHNGDWKILQHHSSAMPEG